MLDNVHSDAFYTVPLKQKQIIKLSTWFNAAGLEIIQGKINVWRERNVINPHKYTAHEKKEQNTLNYHSRCCKLDFWL